MREILCMVNVYADCEHVLKTVTPVFLADFSSRVNKLFIHDKFIIID